jgi:glycosyltransferase involved in cell wall biosynthesis
MARRMVFFTIVANNYLAHARTLMASLLRHHPSSPRYVVVCDEPVAAEELGHVAEVVPAHVFGIRDFAAMAFHYDIMELATAIKPSGFQWLRARHPEADLVYLDPDILVTARLSHVERAFADGASLVLTPHITAPLQDGRHPDDLTIMKSGVYNCGFVAFAPTDESRDFLQWWADRCRRDAVSDVAANKFTDQRWMDLAPCFVQRTHILHNPAYNLAYWNLGQRAVMAVGNDVLVGGQPLRFVHFSGVNPADPSIFSKHQDRFTPATIGGLRPLFAQYLNLLQENGWEHYRAQPYGFGHFSNGRYVHETMRWAYRRHEAEMAENPFRGDGKLFDTAEPSLTPHGPPAITRVMFELWQKRPALQKRFDIQSAAGREEFLRWFAGEGGSTENFDLLSVNAAKAILGGDETVPAPWPPQAPTVHTGPREAIDAWLAEKVPLNPPLDESGTVLPRHLALLWEARADLRQHFALRSAAELDAFILWAMTFGGREGTVDFGLLEPALGPWLDTTEQEAIEDGPPVTRLMRLLAPSYNGPFPHAAADFPITAMSRCAVGLWVLSLADSIGADWPPAFTATLRGWARRRAARFADQGPPITNLVHAAWMLRSDVREVSDLAGLEGQLRLITWMVSHGMRELKLPLSAISDELMGFLSQSVDAEVREITRLHSLCWAAPGPLRLRFDVSRAEGKRRLVRHMAEARADQWDYGHWINRMLPAVAGIASAPADSPDLVLVTGLHGTTSGRSEDARMTAAVLRAQGTCFALLDRTTGALTDGAGDPLDPEAVRFPVNIVHHNADSAALDYVFLRRKGVQRAYTIGYWAWELARLPEEWHGAFAYYDEIWASSRFACEAFRAASGKPVRLMPMAVAVPEIAAGMTRADFDLPEESYVFFYGFDLRSFVARKNPQAAIAAFRAAFPTGGENVRLLLKSLNGEAHPDKLAELRALAAGDPRILVRDQEFGPAEHARLVQLCDAYLSLHRAEGFGRGPAEAMLLGKPTIVTAYSGTADFCSEETALLVDCTLVPVQSGEYPGWEGQEWAEPDIAQAAAHMRRLVDEPALGQRLGDQARARIMALYSPDVVGRAYAERLAELLAPPAAQPAPGPAPAMPVVRRRRRASSMAG